MIKKILRLVVKVKSSQFTVKMYLKESTNDQEDKRRKCIFSACILILCAYYISLLDRFSTDSGIYTNTLEILLK